MPNIYRGIKNVLNDKLTNMNIIISEIEIIPIKPHNGLLAFTSFILNHAFYIGDVAIYSRLNKPGYRLVYPAKVLANGAKVNCFHPINKDIGQVIEDAVVKKYSDLILKSDNNERTTHETRETQEH